MKNERPEIGTESLNVSEAARRLPKPDESPLAYALALVEELGSQMSDRPRRVLGVNDAATEIRQMREERTP